MFKTPFHGVDVFVSVCVLLFCLLYVEVCVAPVAFRPVRSVSKTLALEQYVKRGTTQRVEDTPSYTSCPLSAQVNISSVLRSLSWPYVLNRYSRIPGTQPHEYEYRIPPAEPCIRQEHIHIQGYLFTKRANHE